MARPIWNGRIAFGLVNIPVTLYSAENRTDLHLRLIDSRNSARVRYERINEETGEEVPWDKIVKGFEYDNGSYVLLSDDELENASTELTKIIEIENFVNLDEINPMFFDKPYYLAPGKGGDKGYVLLRIAMAESGRVGIAQVVIRTRQYLAAVRPQGNALILELLRYQHELRDVNDLKLPGDDLEPLKITKKEREMAHQLIDSMTVPWDPSQYRDEYYEAVMRLVQEKLAAGKTHEVVSVNETPAETPATVNFMEMLKRSVETTRQAKKQQTAPSKGKSRSTQRSRRSKPTKKRAS